MCACEHLSVQTHPLMETDVEPRPQSELHCFHPFTQSHIHPLTHLYIHPFTHPHVHTFTHQPIHLFTHIARVSWRFAVIAREQFNTLTTEVRNQTSNYPIRGQPAKASEPTPVRLIVSLTECVTLSMIEYLSVCLLLSLFLYESLSDHLSDYLSLGRCDRLIEKPIINI